MAAAVTTDEIYKRYLDKAIKEILRLEHEVAAAAEGRPVAQPTGHPLGTIFLLKYGPQAQELAGGRRLLRPRGPRAEAVARAAARRPERGVRHELRQVRRRRHGDVPRLAAARAADRPAAARRRDGRRRARVRERARVPALAPARARRRASCSASRRRSRRSSPPTSTRRSTSRPPRRASGTPSSRSGPGGPHCRRTRSLARARSSRGTRLAPHVRRSGRSGRASC